MGLYYAESNFDSRDSRKLDWLEYMVGGNEVDLRHRRHADQDVAISFVHGESVDIIA